MSDLGRMIELQMAREVSWMCGVCFLIGAAVGSGITLVVLWLI